MVEKMKLLHITGPKNDIDRVVKQYLNKYEIHFENAMTSLGNNSYTRPFVESNQYKEDYKKGKELLSYFTEEMEGEEEMSPSQAREIIRQAYDQTEDMKKQEQELAFHNQKLQQLMKEIGPYRTLDFEFKKMLQFQYIKFRFGRMPVKEFYKVERHIAEIPHVLFHECYSDERYVWGVYFVPHIYAMEIDALYLSFHFERCYIPNVFDGTMEEAYLEAEKELEKNQTEIEQISLRIKESLQEQAKSLYSAYHVLEEYCSNFDIRKVAACTRTENHEEYYILYGWMTKEDAWKFHKEIEGDKNIHYVEEDIEENESICPPTKLKNPKILKPFELFVEMYGLPSYREMDPTWFIALTYTLMFGIMFGDVGQGLCLVVGGFLLYRFKGMRLAGIVALAGIWSTIFGFLYGSIFGFEELMHPLWRRPMEDIMGTLLMAILFGGVLIIVAMVLHIINAIRAKELGKLLFDPSGVAGLICYGSVAICALLIATGKPLPAAIILAIVVGLPLLAIFLKEPLEHLIEKKGNLFPEGSKVMFFVEAFVELFDVVLSYATNTISFVRVGAFALSHAGMMGVVLSLAGVEKGTTNWLIIILGNILVTGLEGLVVGIQVLRLEYYEMFSRFYRGDGKPFEAFRKIAKEQK